VLDVQPKLAARVRLVAAGAVNNNDPDDAGPVAGRRCGPGPCARWCPMTIPPS